MRKYKRDNFEVLFIHKYEANRNEDIVVYYNDMVYSATVFTLVDLKNIMNKHSLSGECLNGTFFTCPDMLIVKDQKRNTILEVISHLIKEDEIDIALKQINAK